MISSTKTGKTIIKLEFLRSWSLTPHMFKFYLIGGEEVNKANLEETLCWLLSICGFHHDNGVVYITNKLDTTLRTKHE
jgi:hypothetical protein